MIERVVFMGTPEFAVPALGAIADRYTVCGVFTQPDRPVGRGMQVVPTPVKKRALELKIPVFQPEKLSDPAAFEQLKTLNPSVIVVVAYGQILKKEVLMLPELGCVNIHASLLPRWRGAAPIQWSILGGDIETGITTMRMSERMDSGNILLQTHTRILPEDTYETLYLRLSDLGADLIVKTLEGLADDNIIESAQKNSEVTYAPKITKEQGVLDPQDKAAEIDRKVRAFNPWPGAWLEVPGIGRVKVVEGKLWKDLAIPAGILTEKGGMLMIGTIDGSYECKRLQMEGKAPLPSAEFINGLKGRGQSLPIQLSSKK